MSDDCSSSQISIRAMKGSRTAYGILIVVPDGALRCTGRMTPGASSYLLCVQHYISFTFRTLMYKLSCLAKPYRRSCSIESVPPPSELLLPKTHSATLEVGSPPRRTDAPRAVSPCWRESEASFLRPSGMRPYSRFASSWEVEENHLPEKLITEVKAMIETLSPREFGILRSSKRFEAEVRRAYSNGKDRHAPAVMKGYAVIKPFLSTLKPDSNAKEFRWSPPKGGPLSNGSEETHLEVVIRETEEETGLTPEQYKITDLHSPFIIQYQAYDCNFQLVLYMGQLRELIPFPFHYENSTDPRVPIPLMKQEIARTALIPINLLHEYFPLEYGACLRDMLTQRLEIAMVPKPIDRRRPAPISVPPSLESTILRDASHEPCESQKWDELPDCYYLMSHDKSDTSDLPTVHSPLARSGQHSREFDLKRSDGISIERVVVSPPPAREAIAPTKSPRSLSDEEA